MNGDCEHRIEKDLMRRGGAEAGMESNKTTKGERLKLVRHFLKVKTMTAMKRKDKNKDGRKAVGIGENIMMCLCISSSHSHTHKHFIFNLTNVI